MFYKLPECFIYSIFADKIDYMKTMLQNFRSKYEFNGILLEDEPIAPKTTFRVGGTAELFAKPEDVTSIKAIISFARENSIPYFILGGGSNIVFGDYAYKGIVISTGGFRNIESVSSDDEGISENAEDCGKNQAAPSDSEQNRTPSEELNQNTVYVKCGAGVPTNTLVNFCTENNLWNAQEFAGLPGSIGGAVFMNARCFNKSISDIFKSARYLNLETLEEESIEFNESDWDYKKSPFQNKPYLILETVFRLEKNAGEKQKLKEEAAAYIADRVAKGHFKNPSAGSVFKNNRDFGEPSGKIIDNCGLKGFSIGGAQIAPWHGNFIINTGTASADNIIELVKLIQDKVMEKTGFLLETEIIFSGQLSENQL